MNCPKTHPTDALRLVPCPFCGGEPEIEQFGNTRRSTIYCCQECGCKLETGEEFNHGRAWNRRAAPASPLPEGGGEVRVPVKRKLEAGMALRDRLKQKGDGFGAQVVADLVGSLRASQQNNAALFAQMKEARELLAEILDSDKDWLVLAPDQNARVSAFLARNGKGEG